MIKTQKSLFCNVIIKNKLNIWLFCHKIVILQQYE